jgi:hypothetical protein
LIHRLHCCYQQLQGRYHHTWSRLAS